jgi:diguanylate cyclase (GGDEF)-like protein
MVHVAQLTILTAEAFLVGSLILLLFWLRRFIGLPALYVGVGALQYFQVMLAGLVFVEVLPGIWGSPGSMVFFPATVFAVLLVYAHADAGETRKLAYGLVISNVALFVLSLAAGQHLRFDGHQNPLQLSTGFFSQNARVVAVGTTALLIDVLALIVIFEAISRWTSRSLFTQAWASLVGVMAIDSLVFGVGVFAGQPTMSQAVISGFVGKAIFSSAYAALLVAYARCVEVPGHVPLVDRGVAGVFQMLTYRKRYEEARQLVARDALTGLFNRGYFDEYLPKQLAHAARSHEPTSLVLIDVDNLKTVNDRHGHQAGDALIRFVAATLRDFVRQSDTACRYGGDEFAVVLTSADGPAARIFSERLLERIVEGSKRPEASLACEQAAVTIGIATAPTEARTVGDLIGLADRRLYEGKRGGRARVTGGAAESVGAPLHAHA